MKWFKELLTSILSSDGGESKSYFMVANTSLSHQAIGLWFYLGFTSLFIGNLASFMLAVLTWGVIWEFLQYIKNKRPSTLRDWIFGDLPSYVVGALAGLILLKDTAYGEWACWFTLTALVVAHPALQAALFGKRA